MQVDFTLPLDGKEHRFCVDCRAEDVNQVRENGKAVYHCNVCGHTNPRAIYFYRHKSWEDETGELWHESSGVFVKNQDNKYLFFKRTEFPILLTIPSGHVDTGESPELAGKRELEEESGIVADRLVKLGTEKVIGDSCSSGADSHVCHTYFLKLDKDEKVTLSDEGEKALWLTLDEVESRGLVFGIDHIIKIYRQELDSL